MHFINSQWIIWVYPSVTFVGVAITTWAFLKTRRKGYLVICVCYALVLAEFASAKITMRSLSTDFPPDIKEKIEQRGKEHFEILKKYQEVDNYTCDMRSGSYEPPPDIKEKMLMRSEEMDKIDDKYREIDAYMKERARRPIHTGIAIASRFSIILLMLGLLMLAIGDVRRLAEQKVGQVSSEGPPSDELST